jgi:hypothetical protein
MKIQSLLLVTFLVFTSVLSACGSPDSAPGSAPQPTLPPPTPTATTVPTLEPTNSPDPALEQTSLPIPTLSPADITITFEGGSQCTYDGPEPIPAVESLTVNWYVTSTDVDFYGLLVVIVDEGHTKEDLIREMKSAFPPPSWTEHVGNFEGAPRSSMQGTIKASNGPLRGPLYFACWSGSSWDTRKPFATLGPFDVQ